MKKEITVVYYGYRRALCDWKPNVDQKTMTAFVKELQEEYETLGITINYLEEPDNSLEVRGYGDLLNTVRLRSPRDHIRNLCLGHVIGQSANCDLFEDIRRGVSRVAFAPETIEPEGSNKVVCHNCGCGC